MPATPRCSHLTSTTCVSGRSTSSPGNSEVGAGGGEDGIETVQCANFAAASDNAFALYIWRSPWVGIGQCNIVINSLSADGMSPEIYNRSMGEAYFLRAHYYYILVRLFGGCPCASNHTMPANR